MPLPGEPTQDPWAALTLESHAIKAGGSPASSEFKAAVSQEHTETLEASVHPPEHTLHLSTATLELAAKKCSRCEKNPAMKGVAHCKQCHSAQVQYDTRTAVIWQESLHLAEADGGLKLSDGLFWKVACKSGTLALSPGPGQTDSETPLILTGDLFRDMKLSLEEKAFPYCTVPETHNNGSLENTGYVKASDVLTRDELLADERIPERLKLAAGIQDDPAETEYLLAGIEFTEPAVAQKAANGSIPDTSIGVKFNYRNKRSGNLFKAAWEHLALTPVPWVDGLVPFGLDQGAVFDQEQVPDVDVFVEPPHPDIAAALKLGMTISIRNNRWDDISIDNAKAKAALEGLETGDKLELPLGVCVQRLEDEGQTEYLVQAGYEGMPVVKHSAEDAAKAAFAALKAAKKAEDKDRAKAISAGYGQKQRRGFDLSGLAGNILPGKRNPGTLHADQPSSTQSSRTRTTMPQKTVEEILAQEQAAREAAEARVTALEAQLALSQETTGTLVDDLHTRSVKDKVTALNGKVAPAVLLAAKAVWTEDKPGASASAEGLQLSVAAATTEDPAATRTVSLKRPSDVVDFILSAMPDMSNPAVAQIYAIHTGVDALALAQGDTAKSNVEVAAEQVTQWRKDNNLEDQPISA